MSDKVGLLVFGASGFLGREIYNQGSIRLVQCFGTSRAHMGNHCFMQFDFLEPNYKSLVSLVWTNVRNRYAVLCSGLCQIDACNDNPNRSHLINVVRTIELVKWLSANGFKIVFISTDNVFDGERGMYSEDDKKSPLNLYGRQKSEVEDYVLGEYGDALVFRLSKLIAPYKHKKNLFSDWESQLIAGQDILCIKDQVLCPISVVDVARIIIDSIMAGLSGLYHIAGEPVVRSSLANVFIERLGLGLVRVVDRDIGSFGFSDARPIKVVLDSSKIKRRLRPEINTALDLVNQYRASCGGFSHRIPVS